MHKPEIVLLGGPNSGKTHYAGQLYGRLQRCSGLLQLRQDQGTPADLSPFEEVFRCLSSGRAANHTSAGTWVEVLLPLVDKQGNTLDLRWPDYGGEQIKTVFERREVPEEWRQRLINADGWLLLIQLQTETVYLDALDQLTERANHSSDSNARASNWDANARWVELLQILLQVAGLGTVERLKAPRLAVLLSCYDEIEVNDEPPPNVLAKRLPLLSAFINSVWTTDSLSVWGLSALGCRLENDSNNEDFIDGPEDQGWIVAPEGGEPDSDLSRPLAWLLEAP